MRKLYLFIFLLFTLYHAYPQQGDLFITNFTPGENADRSANFDLVQRPDGILTIANRSGLLMFDGQEWEIFSSSGTPVSLVSSTDGIYAGGGFGVGFQPYNNPSVFTRLHKDSLIQNVIQVERVKSRLLAIENQKLHIFSLREKKLLHSIPFENGYLKKILLVNGKPLLVTSTGNYWLYKESLTYAETVPDEDLSFSVQVEGYDLIGTSSGKIYSAGNDKWEEIILDLNGFEESVAEVEFIDAVRVNNLLAINTLNSGVILLNISEMKINRVVNYHNGLSDSETYFIAADADGGIWVGHDFGLSRIATNLPFETLSNFPGLEGNLLNAVNFNGQLHVGTSTGLYKLEEVKDFNEVVQYVKNVTTVEKSIEPEEERNRGIFNFLKRKKENQVVDTTSEETKISYQKKVTRELKSIKYIFKKVPEIDAKVVRQISTGDELFAGTLRGLFVITENQAIQLSKDAIKLIWVNRGDNLLIANTYNGNLLSFRKNDQNEWEKTSSFDGYQDNLMDIYEDVENRVWFVSDDEIYFITYDNNTVFPGSEFRYNNPYLDPTFVTENAFDELIFHNRTAEWRYDEENDRLIATPLENSFRKLTKGANGLWMRTNDQWHSLTIPIDNPWINIFDNATFLSADKGSEDIYVITDSNYLYKLPLRNSLQQYEKKKKILLRYVSEEGRELVDSDKFRINQKQSDIAFEFVKPEYTGVIDIKYRYRVKGMSQGWTEWSTDNNHINLSFLPEGNYTLELMARTSLGEEIRSDDILLDVVPPYWKRPWFYAFEFTLLGMLLLLTIYLNHNSRRYRLLNKLLAFLTLIIIIEFIQVSAESYFETDISPIIGFAIQVTVAFIVLPVEGFLRKLIMQDKKLKLPLYLRFRR